MTSCNHNLAEMNAAAHAEKMCPACREQLRAETLSALRRFILWFDHNEHADVWDEWIDQFYELQEISDRAKQIVAKERAHQIVTKVSP